jgi:hypothetical protein
MGEFMLELNENWAEGTSREDAGGRDAFGVRKAGCSEPGTNHSQ